MSSIKKYIDGSIKDWVKFGETNCSPDQLSSANNISIDFNLHESVNQILKQHEEDIQKLKRNVSWLALHGGGGSSGSGTGTTSRKASCTILVNESSKEISITENQTIYVTLSNFKGSSDSIPWKITVSFDGTEVYYGSKSQGAQEKITFAIDWSYISSFFEGSGKNKNHIMFVQATYNDTDTQLEGKAELETYVYIPAIDCIISFENKYNSDIPSTCTGNLTINTALTGTFALKMISESYSKTIEYSFEFQKQTSDSSTFTIENILPAFKSDNIIQHGVYNTTFYVIYDNQQGEQIIKQTVYSKSQRIIIFSNEVSLLVNFSGISVSSEDEKRTKIYDNLKNLLFSFYAFKNGINNFIYSVKMIDESVSKEITVIENANGIFEKNISVNKIVNDLETNHKYKVILQITPSDGSELKEFYCYVICEKGEYSFITYTDDAETTRLFELDPFNDVFDNSSLKNSMQVLSKNTSNTVIGNTISSTINFYQINPRSGVIPDIENKKALRLYDTYMDLANEFKYTVKSSGVEQILTNKIQDNKKFTICLCYQSQNYSFSSQHSIFSLCNNGLQNSGIVLKTDGLYIKGSKVLTIYGDKIVSVVLVYNNSSSESSNKWGSTSYFKVYINGVITYVTDSCPFLVSNSGEITNNNLKIQFSGFNSEQTTRDQLCNCDLYDIEIFSNVMNEIDILASYINNKLRTTYKNSSPDFTLIKEELKKNCCDYITSSHTISSGMYPITGSSERKFEFNGILLKNNEVPTAESTEELTSWISNLSSLSLPITYIDIKGSQSTTASDWTFNNFITTGGILKDRSVIAKFYYWDPKTNRMPISSDYIEVKTQGTSTQEDYIKNLEIKFASKEDSGDIVQDLLFLKNDWLPENSYVLKADIVDSSHANNASIGKFINTNFYRGNDFGFNFDSEGIAASNINQSTTTLKTNQRWNIDPVLKHTVEGFQTLLLVRFYTGNFINLGIYSFNIGRNAARNLGFEYITKIEQKNGEVKSLITDQSAPSILSNVIVTNGNTGEFFWVENSNSQNFDGLSSWTSDTTRIIPDEEGETTGTNPGYECRFWHCQQGTVDQDSKLNNLFETKYYSTADARYPASIDKFKTFVKQISQLPVEGLLKTDALTHNFNQIIGSYATAVYNNNEWKRYSGGNHTLIETDLEDANINTFNPRQIASYYVIALLFGLIDNLDKNISFRIFGDSKVIADFYDMDTALGLNNAGLDDVSPTVGSKIIKNYRNSLFQDYPEESFDFEKAKEMYSKYSKYLPETYSNKLWLSLDSNAMRKINGITYSLYSDLWFKLRKYIDNIATEQGYSGFVDLFVNEYFGNQVNCGTFIYNYDYTIKYLNDYEQTGQKQSNNTISKLHGRRIDEVKEWLQQHVDFLDTYFYWRNNYTFIEGSSVPPIGLKSVVTEKISMTSSSNNKQIEIETSYPVIVHSSSTADGDEVGDTLTIDNTPQNIKVSGGGTDKAMAMNCSSLLKNLDLVSLGVKKFRSQGNSKISFIENLILDGLEIVADGISLDDFIDTTSSNIASLIKISMNQTKFSQGFNLDLDKYQLLNVSYVDIENSKNITSLKFYESESSEDTTTQNLKTLKVNNSQIENLNLKNQSYLILPKIDDCQNLVTLDIKNCNLDNLDNKYKYDSSGNIFLSNYLDINLSSQSLLKTIDIENVEHIKTLKVNKCQSIESLILKNVSALQSIQVDNNIKLSSVDIFNCPNLTSIQIQNCSNIESLELLSVNNLVNLNLNYDSGLSSLKISKDSVKNIQTINLRNVDITGFNYYNYDTKTYDPIISIYSPSWLENIPVLDFSPFESLNSNGITLRKMKDGDYSQDKCSNFRAIRLPNTKDRAYDITDKNNDQIGECFSNLIYLFGHVQITSGSFGYGYGCQYLELFYYDEDLVEYTGYPKFIDSLFDGQIEKLSSMTIFDKIQEKCITLSEQLNGQDNLSQIEDYIDNGFIECDDDNFHEFDTREWATNYTVTNLTRVLEDYNTNEFLFQYLLYRYAIYIRNNQKNNVISNIQYSIKYCPHNINYSSEILFPLNTFKFIGRTFSNINKFIHQSPKNINNIYIPYRITKAHLSCMPNLTAYNGFSSHENINYDSLSENNGIKLLGINNSYDHVTKTNIIGDSSYKFFEPLTQLEEIINFNPYGITLSKYTLPNTIKKIQNSFINQTESTVLDLSLLFYGCNSLESFSGSFGSSQFLLKPSTFTIIPSITEISFNNDCKKYIVEDEIDLETFLDSYKEELKTYSIEKNYTQEMFNTFIEGILDNNEDLTSTQSLFANSYIPYQNILNMDYIPFLISNNIFQNNNKITNVTHLFDNVKFLYQLNSNMFNGLTNLQDVSYAFANTTSISTGISSDIPYRLFYQGHTINTIVLSGTDRFEKNIYSFNDFKNNVIKTYYPSKIELGQTSFGFDELSNCLSQAGLLNISAYEDVSSYLTIDTTKQYANLITELEDYKDICPLQTVIQNEETEELSVQVNQGAQPLINTISTLYMNLSVEDNWKEKLCKLSSISLTYNNYIKNIRNFNCCFYGNANIQPYKGSYNEEGKINSESNSLYNPFILNYIESEKKFQVNTSRNTFKEDDSWTSNGKIWKLGEDGWIIDTDNYDSTHYNSTTEEMRVISCDTETEHRYNQNYLVIGGILKDGKYTSNYYQWFEYVMTYAQATEFRYMCAPDLFRYGSVSINELSAVFKNCDMFINTPTDPVTQYQSIDDNPYIWNRGITGRIPPNLFYPLTNLQRIPQIFQNCYHITGYEKTTDNEIHTYIIPETLFEKSSNIYKFTEAFSGILINYSCDLTTPFNKIIAGSFINGIKLDIESMMKNCIWYKSGSINQLFISKYFSNINKAFYCYINTNIESNGRRIKDYGTRIESNPEFYVFTDTKFITQNKISQTYYKDMSVNSKDVARATSTSENPITPSK